MEQKHLICEHISVSRKQTWSECQQKYKFRYHLKVIPDAPQQPYFTYGKVVHKIAEVYVQEKGARSIGQIAADVMSGKIVADEASPGPVKLDASYRKKLPEHIRAVQTLTDKIGYDGETELPFRYDMQPPDSHMIVGVIDRLIVRKDKYFILDYKTTKKGRWRKNSSTIRDDLQLNCYARVVQKQFGAKVENIRAALFYVDGGDLVSTKFTEDGVSKAEKELHDAYKTITSTSPDDVYGRTGDHCKRCDYVKVCPFWSLT
jgi:CRISPR/Cas system-associated exonuclease Cas4 (RecB family)